MYFSVKICLLFFLSMVSLHSLAQNTLTVYQKDGGKMSFAFIEKPQVIFNGGKIIITSRNAKVEFESAEIQKFTFKDNETSTQIYAIKVEDANFDYTEIYTLGGKLVRKQKSTDNPSTMLAEELSRGTYIIKHGHSSYKVVKSY